MNTTITLDEAHFKAVSAQAEELGTTPAAYVQTLIDAAATTFDDVAAPFRESFVRGGATEDALDDAVNEARKALRPLSGGH